jgi:hypothetical protein
LLWVKQEAVMNTIATEQNRSIAVDSLGNCYVSYRTNGTVSGGTLSGGQDIVMIKLDTNGSIQWIKQQAVMNSVSNDYNPSIAVDSVGDCYISYQTVGVVSGGTNSGLIDIVVFKISTDGIFQWIQQQSVMNTSMDDINSTIAVDDIGNSYITYQTMGSVSGGINSSSYDIVVFKLSKVGVFQWIKQQPLMNTIPSISTPLIYTDVTSYEESGGNFTIPTSGLAAWYDTSSFTGTAWNDKSGNGNNSESITGTLTTGDDGVVFNGTQRVNLTNVALNLGGITGWTIFMVGRVTGTNENYIFQTINEKK